MIKIEHPKAGDGMRGHGPSLDGTPIWWSEISRNKRTVALSLSTPEGADVFRRLVATADVLVENFRPGTLERWGLSPETLHELNPGLVLARITGFGQTGPYAARAGFGTLAEAMSGFAAPDRRGRRPADPAGLRPRRLDLRHRRVVGRSRWRSTSASSNGGTGQVIDLSLLEPIMTAVGPGPSVYGLTGEVGTAPRQPLDQQRPAQRLRDQRRPLGRDLDQRPGDRRAGADAGRPPRGASTSRGSPPGSTRAQHADLLDGYVGGWIADRTRDEVVAAFTEAGAAVAPVYSARDLVEDEHVRATADAHRRSTTPPSAQVLQHNVMWRMSETPGRIRFPGRPIGADTDAVLTSSASPPTNAPALRDQGDHPMTDHHAAARRRRAPGCASSTSAARSRSGCRSRPTTRRTGTPTRAGTATWCAPTAARRPTT